MNLKKFNYCSSLIVPIYGSTPVDSEIIKVHRKLDQIDLILFDISRNRYEHQFKQQKSGFYLTFLLYFLNLNFFFLTVF